MKTNKMITPLRGFDIVGTILALASFTPCVYREREIWMYVVVVLIVNQNKILYYIMAIEYK